MVRKFWKINKAKNCFQSPKYNEKDSDNGSEADTIKKSINYGTTLQAAKGTFLEYFKESSIHGFKYIGNHRHSVADRFIWLCALVLSIITCCFLIRNIWDQRINNPVIVSFNEKLTPVWEIPFPSVTICPETKTQTRIFNFTDIYWKIRAENNITEEEEFYWDAISQICQVGNVSPFYGNVFANASDLNRAMIKAAPTMDQAVFTCVWRSLNSCTESVKRVITEEGICFSFNSLTSKHYQDELINAHTQDQNFYYSDNPNVLDWNIEKGYSKGEGLDTIPSRVIGASTKEGLILYLQSQKEDKDLVCGDSTKGFKIILHTPGEEPQTSKHFIHAPFEKTVLVTIKPKIVNASEGLKAYEPHRRQCYYQQNDRSLRYFKVYSQPNCLLECLANKTLDMCGCVKFSMPRNSTHPVCGSLKINCLLRAKHEIDNMNFMEANSFDQSDNSRTSCNCLPLCTSIAYKAELGNQIDFDYIGLSRAFKSSNYFEKHPGLQITKIYIHFKEENFSGLKRSELYSKADFIANCGGLLGLFMGVSILSLVELVYFFTIKLWSNLKIRKIKNRKIRKSKEKA